MARRRNKPVELKLRLYPGQDDDLISWLDGLDGMPFGAKAQAIREALRRGLGASPQAGSAGAQSSVDPGDLRRIVEAAVTSALERWNCAGAGTRAQSLQNEEDEEVAEILDSMESLAF